MMNSKGLTVPERILLAAADLHSDRGTFSAEDLVIQAWQRFPTYFGLQGYGSQYPDSNRVFSKIMGRDVTVRKAGWLAKVGTKRYRLTEVGLVKAREIAGRKEDSLDRLDMSRGLLTVLGRLLASGSLRKFPDERDAISFGDLCAFYDVSPRSTARQLTVKCGVAREAIAAAIALAEKGVKVLPGGEQQVDSATLDRLERLDSFLRNRFQRELDVIRQRTDERRLT
jgi:hypothetical protein